MASSAAHNNSISPKHLALILAPLVAITPFAIDTYLPALPAMASELQVELAAMGQTISFYLIGFALGQLVGGPLSDLYGRHTMAISGLLVFIACGLGILWVDSLDWLIALRFIQALGGGFASVVVAAIVREHFSGKDSARVFSMIGMIMMVAPLIAPAVGSLILSFAPWQGIFIFLISYALIMVLLVLRFIRPKNTPSAAAHTSGTDEQIPSTGVQKPHPVSHIRQAYASVLQKRPSFKSLLAQAAVSGILFTYVTNASYLFMGYYGLSEQQFPFYFGALVGASILSGRLNLKLLQHFSRLGILRTAVSAQFTLTVGLLIAHLLGFDQLWLLMAVMVVMLGSIGLIYSNNFSMYLDYHGDNSGSASALFGCATFTAGALLGSISASLHNDSLIPLIGTCCFASLLGCLCIWSIKGELKTPA